MVWSSQQLGWPCTVNLVVTILPLSLSLYTWLPTVDVDVDDVVDEWFEWIHLKLFSERTQWSSSNYWSFDGLDWDCFICSRPSFGLLSIPLFPSPIFHSIYFKLWHILYSILLFLLCFVLQLFFHSFLFKSTLFQQLFIIPNFTFLCSYIHFHILLHCFPLVFTPMFTIFTNIVSINFLYVLFCFIMLKHCYIIHCFLINTILIGIY